MFRNYFYNQGLHKAQSTVDIKLQIIKTGVRLYIQEQILSTSWKYVVDNKWMREFQGGEEKKKLLRGLAITIEWMLAVNRFCSRQKSE